jgi:hypothetical protein
MIVALYAAVAMVASDIFGTLLTQAQARNKAALAGWCDTAGWLVAIFTTSWSVAAVNGHDTAKKFVVLAAVSAANFVGSYAGTKIGARWVKAATPLPLELHDCKDRLDAITERVTVLEMAAR